MVEGGYDGRKTYKYEREFVHGPTSEDDDPKEHGKGSAHSDDVHSN